MERFIFKDTKKQGICLTPNCGKHNMYYLLINGSGAELCKKCVKIIQKDIKEIKL